MVLRRALRRLASTSAFTVGTIRGVALGTGVTLAVFTVRAVEEPFTLAPRMSVPRPSPASA